MGYVLAIDPGPVESAYVIVDEDVRPIEFDKVMNEDLLKMIAEGLNLFDSCNECAIEMIASYGMAVGKEVFDTCVWIGRFYEQFYRSSGEEPSYIYRKEVKSELCGSMKAKDSNIRQALIDLYGDVGTKKAPGWFYGFKKDIWSAYAVSHTYKACRSNMGV